jgi:hypothetical protein
MLIIDRTDKLLLGRALLFGSRMLSGRDFMLCFRMRARRMGVL